MPDKKQTMRASLWTLLILLFLGAGYIAYKTVITAPKKDWCQVTEKEIYCVPACHPSEVHARRLLATMDKIPVSLRECANLAAGAVNNDVKAGVEACISKASNTDPSIARIISEMASRLNPPTDAQIRNWEKGCNQGPDFARPEDAKMDVDISQMKILPKSDGSLYDTLRVEVRLTNKKDRDIPLDSSSQMVVFGSSGDFRLDIPLKLLVKDQHDRIVTAGASTPLILTGSFPQSHYVHLDKGFHAYVQLFYDRSLEDEEHWFLSEFFEFSKARLNLYK